MKKFISGIIVGCILTASTSVFADGALEKITAYLRPDLPIMLDGKKVTLEDSPVMVDGSTYLPLRKTAELFGGSASWNESTQTVELSKTAPLTQKDSGGVKPVDQARLQRNIDEKKELLSSKQQSLEHYVTNKESMKKAYPDSVNDIEGYIVEQKNEIEKLQAELADLEKQKAELQVQK